MLTSPRRGRADKLPERQLADKRKPKAGACLPANIASPGAYERPGFVLLYGVPDPANGSPQREERDRNYGLTPEEAGDSGPSVVTINGVVASLACTEALMFITGLRAPARQLTYLGQDSVVRKNNSEGDPQCLYCTRWRDARRRRVAS